MTACGITRATDDAELVCVLDKRHLIVDPSAELLAELGLESESITHMSADGTRWSCVFDREGAAQAG